jgi:hypothetical protein
MVKLHKTLKGGDQVQELKQKAIMKATRAGILATLVIPGLAGAAEGPIQSGANSAKPDGTPRNLGLTGDGIFKDITNTLILIVGAVAVLMLIIGGLRYVLSGGNSSNVESAKNTIFYAIIGIVVAILAFAIVNFVIGAVG